MKTVSRTANFSCETNYSARWERRMYLSSATDTP
jgi:hypothetical protein